MNKMCPSGSHHHEFAVTYALVIALIAGRAHCFHDFIYYAHLASVKFECFSCNGALVTIYITFPAQLVEHFLVSLAPTVCNGTLSFQVPELLQSHSSVTGRAQYFHNFVNYVHLHFCD